MFASLQAPSKPGMHTELLELLSCLLFVNTIVVTVYARQITQHNSPLELVVWAAISMCIFTFVTMHLKVLQQRFLQAHSTNRDSCKHILQTEIPASTFYKQRFLQAHSTNRDSCKHILQTEIPASTFYKQKSCKHILQTEIPASTFYKQRFLQAHSTNRCMWLDL